MSERNGPGSSPDPTRGFTDHERCLLIHEIGRMEELSFGSALELLDRLFGIAILSPVGETQEPVDTGHLAMLIRQVSLRQDLTYPERRVLMQKLASVGMGPAGEYPSGRSFMVNLFEPITAWIRRGSKALTGRVRSHDSVDPGPEPLREAERIVRNIGRFIGRKSIRRREPCPTDLFHEIEMQDERLGRSVLGDEVYERFRQRESSSCRRKRRQSTMRGAGEYDSSSSESADEKFARWLWGDE